VRVTSRRLEGDDGGGDIVFGLLRVHLVFSSLVKSNTRDRRANEARRALHRRHAWTGGSVVIAVVDGIGNLYYGRQADGSPTWEVQRVPIWSASGTTSPSIGATANSVVIAAVDGDGNLNLWSQPSGGIWTGQIVASGIYCNPSIVTLGSSVFITANRGEGNGDNVGNVYFFWPPSGKQTQWNTKEVGTSIYSNPSIAASSSSMVIAAGGLRIDDLYYWWQAGSPEDWQLQEVASLVAGNQFVRARPRDQPLVGTRGPNFPLSRLEPRLMCPACGNRRVTVVFEPPSNAQVGNE
jgi:hypothetical protein